MCWLLCGVRWYVLSPGKIASVDTMQVLPEDVVEAEEDPDEPTSFGGWLFGTSPGQGEHFGIFTRGIHGDILGRRELICDTGCAAGCLVLVAFVILSAYPRRKPKRSPLLRSYARID